MQSPPGTVVGFVKQDPLGILNPWFEIQNADGEAVLKIKGPGLGCSCYSDAHFVVRQPYTVKPPVKDTPKENKPPTKEKYSCL